MTSKERAALRGAANGLETVYEIGKGGIDDKLVKGVGEALRARELIKVHVQRGCELSARAAADLLAKKLRATVVQVVGGRFVLYKFNRDVNGYGIR